MPKTSRSIIPPSEGGSLPSSDRALSFSLFGTRSFYCGGMRENLRLAREVYPGWDVVVHVERGNPTIPHLLAGGAVVVLRDPEPGLCGTHWRFDTVSWPEYQWVCCRDADCRVGLRERAAVDEWMASGKSLHTMWDKIGIRRRNISAGMFGLKRWPEMGERVASWPRNGLFGDDENFLNRVVWPEFKDDCIRHRRGVEAGFRPFPAHDPVPGWVGQKRWCPALPRFEMRTYRIGSAGTTLPGEIRVDPVFGHGKRNGSSLAQKAAVLRGLEDGVFPFLVL